MPLVSGWRHQLPVYSPLSASAVLVGARAAARPVQHEGAPQQLITLLGALSPGNVGTS
jgi:hypothetical protein